MGAALASPGLLLDAVDSLEAFVWAFAAVYALLIFAYILTSWIRLPYSFNKVQRFLYDVVDPYLRLFRRILPPLGPLDLSPMVAAIALFLAARVIVWLLGYLH